MDKTNEQLEKFNFIMWYTHATPEEIELAKKNHKDKFDYLTNKYKKDIKSIFNP